MLEDSHSTIKSALSEVDRDLFGLCSVPELVSR
jgi:hypothetical protein